MNNTSYSFIPTPSSIQAWITPEEAAKVIKNETSHDINVSDIYRHALYGNITLSIYFQSPVKIKKNNYIRRENKIKNMQKRPDL